jgi:porin
MYRRILHLCLLSLAWAWAHAEEPAPLTLSGEASLDGAATLQGGARRDQSLHGLALVAADWAHGDAQSGIAWKARVSALGLFGEGPTSRHIGDLLAASNSEGYESARLYATWIEAESGAWNFRTGLLLADEEFAGTESGGALLNSSFGWPAFISANTVNTGPAFFVAAPGARVRVTFSENSALQVGVYDGDTFDSPTGDPTVNKHGLHNRLSRDQGAFVIGEIAHQLNEHTGAKFGAWLHTADFADVYRDAAGRSFTRAGTDPRNHGQNYGGYLSLEHAAGAKAGEPGAVALHVRTGFAPADRNALGWVIDAGARWQGPLPGRPQDYFAVGFAHAEHSGDFSRAAREADPTSPAPDFEQVIELAYGIQFTEKFTLQPDLQYIRHPGGSRANDDALVLIVRARVTF